MKHPEVVFLVLEESFVGGGRGGSSVYLFCRRSRHVERHISAAEAVVVFVVIQAIVELALFRSGVLVNVVGGRCVHGNAGEGQERGVVVVQQQAEGPPVGERHRQIGDLKTTTDDF